MGAAASHREAQESAAHFEAEFETVEKSLAAIAARRYTDDFSENRSNETTRPAEAPVPAAFAKPGSRRQKPALALRGADLVLCKLAAAINEGPLAKGDARTVRSRRPPAICYFSLFQRHALDLTADLNVAAFGQILRKTLCVAHRDASSKDIECLFAAIDADRDGRITPREWAAFARQRQRGSHFAATAVARAYEPQFAVFAAPLASKASIKRDVATIIKTKCKLGAAVAVGRAALEMRPEDYR
ncbi:hypothetical protein M885DRAFT_505018 [Pelagophyceae sp. CCMP2097]|nr:hypothetical protein M885DRAFT_505018 [Pelagophyceae sp. CCMP2097]